MEIRVLVANNGSKTPGGGTVILHDIYSHMDHDKVQADYLSFGETTYEDYREDIESHGGKIYGLGVTGGNPISRKIDLYKRMKKFVQEHNYTIVHINSGVFLPLLVSCMASKKGGVPYVIAHSHNAGNANKSVLRRALDSVMRPFIEHTATELYACSQKAAQYMFTKKAHVKIIKNGIDLARFDYNPAVREEMRRELGVGDKFVVGHIGRFAEQKNHRFLIDIFAKMPENAVLMLVGQGDLEDEIRTKVESLGLTDRVMFLGQRKDVEKLYQAMDVFLFPSLFEGLPVTCIELQTSGLPCVLSDEITKEVKINENMQFLPLSAPPEKWAEEVCKCAGMERRSHAAEVAKAGYSIEQVAKELQEHYLELVK